MKKKTAVLGIFADRIDILVCGRDQALSAKRVDVDLNVDAGWSKALKEISAHVQTAVEELDAGGLSALVLYRNPTAFADYASLGMKSGTQAREAAMLSCAESLSYPLEDASTSAIVLGRDIGGTSPQTHLVVTADQDSAVAEIAAFIEDVGLKFEAAVPMDAALMAHIGNLMLGSKQANNGYLYVGERRSFFLVADRGAILFARKIDLGLETLIWGLTRPVRGTSQQAPVELTFREAKFILHKFGFPQRDQVVEQSRQLTGAQIIPLLQPALQRFIVELRQSLRFGVPEDQRQSIALTIAGPGSGIPNFASLIANELRLPITADSEYAAFDSQNPLTKGSEISDALENRIATTRLGLYPALVSKSRNFNRVRRWFLTGAAAAIAIVTFDAINYHKRLTEARQRVASMDSQANDIQAMHSTADKLFKVIGAMDVLESSIRGEVGAKVDLRACLQELSRVTPSSVRLVSMSFISERGEKKFRLAGCASSDQSSGTRTQLEQFVNSLKTSPLFRDVVLSNVQTAPEGQAPGQHFEISLVSVDLPLRWQTETLASAEGTSQ